MMCAHCGKPEPFCMLCPECEARACVHCGRVGCECREPHVYPFWRTCVGAVLRSLANYVDPPRAERENAWASPAYNGQGERPEA